MKTEITVNQISIVAQPFMTKDPSPLIDHQPDVPECPKMSHLGRLSQLEGSSLNEKQLIAIQMLVTGRSMTTVARKLDVDRRTLHRWRQNETFRRELARLRRQLWSEATDRLRALVHPSLDVLEQELRKGYDRARYRAANAVLRHANLRKSTPLNADEPDIDEEDIEE